jgi:hypothetical protein
MRVIVLCPTIMSTANPIYDTLKYLDEDDIIMDYSDDKLLDKLDEIETEKEEIENFKNYVEVWKKFIKIDDNINLLLPDELFILSKYDFKEPNDIPHPLFKYPRANFLVFDNLVSDANALKKGHSAINHLTIKHRYLQCNLLFIFKFEFIVVFPRTINGLYEVLSNGCNFKELFEVESPNKCNVFPLVL